MREEILKEISEDLKLSKFINWVKSRFMVMN